MGCRSDVDDFGNVIKEWNVGSVDKVANVVDGEIVAVISNDFITVVEKSIAKRDVTTVVIVVEEGVVDVATVEVVEEGDVVNVVVAQCGVCQVDGGRAELTVDHCDIVTRKFCFTLTPFSKYLFLSQYESQATKQNYFKISER